MGETEEEREKNKAGNEKDEWGKKRKGWEAGGRGEMQIQVEPKRVMKRCGSWEGDMKILVCN